MPTIELRVLIRKGEVVFPAQIKSDIFYIPLELRVGGKFIGHLDFRKARDVGMLEQMLRNAIYNLRVHIGSKVRNVREAHAFAHAIEDGFRYADELLKENYGQSKFPTLYSVFRNEYSEFEQREIVKLH